MATQIIHHPPEGGALIPDHTRSDTCLCKPDKTSALTRRNGSTLGYWVTVHYWHHPLPKEKNS